MNQINSSDIKGSIFFFSSSFLLWGLGKWFKNINERYLYHHSRKIRPGSELQNLKENEEDLFKVQIEDSPVLKTQRKIHLNEFFFLGRREFLQPSQIEFKSSQQIKSWRVKADNSKIYDIHGIGNIYGNIFDVEKIIDIDPEFVNIHQHKNKLVYKIEKVLQFLFSPNEQSRNVAHEKVIFKGPEIGRIIYNISLSKGLFVIIKCKLENGKYYCSLISPSQIQILMSLKIQYFLCLSLIAIVSFQARHQIKNVVSLGKKLWNKFWKKNQIPSPLKFKNEKEERNCLICYENNRNIVFMDCCHLVLCSDCFKNYDNQRCPLCRLPFYQAKQICSI